MFSFKNRAVGFFLLTLITASVFVNALSTTVYAAYNNLPITELPTDIQNLEVTYRNFEVACESKVNGDEGTGGRWNSADGALNNTGNYENDRSGNFPCVKSFLAFYKNRKLCYGKGLENNWTFRTGSPLNPANENDVNNDDYNEGKDITYLMRVGEECVAKVVSNARHEKVSDLISSFQNKCGSVSKYNDNKSTCEDLIEKLADYADCNEPSSITDAKIKSYIKDCQSKNNAAKSDEDKAAAGLSGSSGNQSTDDTPCMGGALGWVLCPVVDILIDAIRVVSSLIDSMMQFRILADENSGKALREASNNFTTIANILLVLAFLIIIVSQSTTLGMSNYGIKKMLPRLIIAGILINLSFYICAFLIDLSNIAGASIMGFMANQETVSAAMNKQIGGNGGGPALLGAAIGAIAVVIMFIFFGGAVALGVIITFVMLVARQVILICLVVVAPVAIAAWLLPNTENFFNKWRKLFQDMLLAYPLVMFIFGAAIWSAKLIGTITLAENGDKDASNPAFADGIGAIIQLLVLAIPLLALPFILKGSSAMLGKVAGMAQKYGGDKVANKSASRVKDGLKKTPGIRNGYEMMEQRKSLREQAYGRNRAKRAATRAARGGLTNRALTGLGPDRLSQTGATAREMLAGQAAGAFQKIEQEGIGNARAVMQNDPTYGVNSIAVAEKYLKEAYKNKDKIGVRAALAELSQSAYGVDTAHRLISEFENGAHGEKMGDSGLRDTFATGINDNWSNFKSKDAAVAKWSGKTGGESIASVTSDSSTYSGLKAAELSTQTPTAITEAVNSGGVSAQAANTVLTSSETQSNLSDDNRPEFERALAGGGGAPPTPPPAPGGGPPTPPPAPGGGPPTPPPAPSPPPSSGGGAGSPGGIPIRGTSSGGVILPGERRTRD